MSGRRVKFDPATGEPEFDPTTGEPVFEDAAPVAAPAKPNPRDQVTFLGSETLGKLAADMFPRVAKGTVEGRGMGAQAGAGLIDAITLPGRGIASSGPAPAGATWRDGNPELGRTEGKGFADRVLRDPGTGAAMATAPFTGGLSLMGLPGLAGAGAIAGAASATAHQGERILDGKKFSPGQAAGEVALNTVMPLAAKGAGKVLQAGGKKILDAIVKPSESVREQIGKTGAKGIGDLIFREGVDSPIPFRGGLEGIAKRTDDVRAGANKTFGEVMDANKGVEVDLLKANSDASGKMAQEFADQGKHAGVLPGIKKGEEYWLDALAQKTGNGKAPLAFSQGYKQEAGAAGNFLDTDPGEVKGAARYATELYRQTRDQQNQLVPDLIPLNKTLSDTRPIKDALADALPRIQKNNMITPSDLWTLGPAALAGGEATAVGGAVPGSIAFAAPIVANRLSKNATFASQLFRIGRSMDTPGPVGEARKKAIERLLATSLFAGDDSGQGGNR